MPMRIKNYRLFDEDCFDIVTPSKHLIELEYRPLRLWGDYVGYGLLYTDGSSLYLDLCWVRLGVQYSLSCHR